jgi:hypothetical protein
MLVKKIITGLLLTFVVVSLGTLVLQNSKKDAPTKTTATQSPSTQANPETNITPQPAATQVESPNELPNKTQNTATLITAQEEIIVYYFHGNMRCRACRMIESLTEESVRYQSENQVVSALPLHYKAVNVEHRGNQRFIQNYQLSTRSVVLSHVINGKELNWKRLDGVWQKLGSQTEFIDYVTSEIRMMNPKVPL